MFSCLLPKRRENEQTSLTIACLRDAKLSMIRFSARVDTEYMKLILGQPGQHQVHIGRVLVSKRLRGLKGNDTGRVTKALKVSVFN